MHRKHFSFLFGKQSGGREKNLPFLSPLIDGGIYNAAAFENEAGYNRASTGLLGISASSNQSNNLGFICDKLRLTVCSNPATNKIVNLVFLNICLTKFMH
ncbi:hypothetical protein [Paenibacillus segetis]|uniref:hypothetical protein n=1 Tax=Paenibacillus segetis TaxID=1325360 RepID=UPI001887A6C2|nr:hypothetical protein [Paenibacillus segetis]